MGERKKRIYAALVEGAMQGLLDEQLRAFVQEQCPETTNRNIVRASLLALSDPDIRNAEVLHAIYALAIKYRLDPDPDHTDSPDDKARALPKAEPEKRKKKAK